MAKRYEEDFSKMEGVWRTIGGRKVFIRKGQSLSDAMKESGKFKTMKDVEHQKNKYRQEAERTIEKDSKENWEVYDALDKISKEKETYSPKRSFESYYEKMKSHGEMDSWTGKEYTNDEFMEHLTDSNWHSERKALEEAGLTNEELSYIKDKTSLSKWGVGEELTGKENVNKMIDEAKGKFGTQKEWQKSNKQYFRGDEGKPLSMRTGEPYKETSHGNIRERDAKDLLKQLNDEGSDFTFGDAIIKDGKVKTDVGVFMPDDRGYTTRDLEIPINDNDTYASLEEKLRDWQSKHNSPDTFYDDDFKKNYNINKDVVKEQYLNPDNLIKDNLVRKDEGKNKGNNFYVANVTPEQYLNLTTTPELYNKITNDNKATDFKLDTNKLDNSYMYLTVDPDTGKVVGHNGRHRMLELQKAGYTNADILVFDASGKSTDINKNLKNQFGTGYETEIGKTTKVNDDYFGGDLKQSKPFKTNEANPLEEYANDRIRQKQNTLANDKAMLEGMKRKGITEVGGWTQKDYENRVKKNEDYINVANGTLTSKYKDTIDYLQKTTNMSMEEILDLLRKRGK